MKKLKLQKALLAICLALPITLTKNYAISATEKHIEIIEQQADDKETNAQKKQQEQLELIANQPTHTEALQYYVEITQPQNLGEKEYKHFLQNYIKGDTEKYLALIIQANKNLIQFPNNTHLDKKLTSETIYRMLINNVTDIINPINSKDEPQAKNLLTQIPQYLSKLEQTTKGNLPAVAKILKEIFTPAVTETTSYIMKPFSVIKSYIFGGNKNSTNNLTDLINNYIEQQQQGQEQPTPEGSSLVILFLLDDIAKKLHKEAEAFDKNHGEQKQKLEEIAKQIGRFYHAYFPANNNNKQTAKEEEKKESELNKSNLSFQSQKTDDIIIEDIKEENKNTNTNEELEKNKEVEQEKEKDEPAAQKKDPIINQSISSIKEDESESNEEEEKEEETHSKRNNSTLNIPLSTIGEENNEENDKEDKEEVESPKGKSKDPEIKTEQDETQKEVKDTQTENKKSYDTEIEEIKQLIQDWTQKKEQINKDKEAKLTQLDKDIKELELKYNTIVNGDEEDDDNMC